MDRPELRLGRDAFESLEEGVIVVDRSLRTLHFNRSAEEIVGIPLRGATLEDWFRRNQPLREDQETPVSLDEMPPMVALRGGVAHEEDLFIRSIDRGPYWLRLKARALRDAQGSVYAVLVVLRDVTEQRLEEEGLRRQRELLRSVVDNIAEGVMAVDRQGQTLFLNPAGHQLLGKDPTAVPPDQWPTYCGIYRDDGTTMLSPQEQPLMQALLDKAPSAPQVVVIRNPSLSHESHISVTASALKDRNGEVRGSVAVFREVGAAREAEVALRASEEKFRTIFNASPDVVSVHAQADGRILDVNDRYSDLFKYYPEQVLGKRPIDLGLIPDIDAFKGMLRVLAARGEIHNYELDLRAADGEIHTCLISACNIEMEGEPCVLSFTHDISELRQARDELRAEGRRLTGLLAMQHAIVEAELDDSAVSTAVVEHARTIVDASGAILIEERGRDLVCRAASGVTVRRPGELVPRNSLADRVLQSASPLMSEDSSKDERAGDGLRARAWSVLTVPLRRGDGAHAVLQVTRDDARPFNQHESKALELIAGFAASALRQARQFAARNALRAQLARSEESLRRMFTDSHIGMCMVGLDGRFLEANHAFRASLGYDWEELRTKTFIDLTHPDDRAPNRKLFEQMLAGEGTVSRFDKRYLSKDRAVIWKSLSAAMVSDAAGKPLHIITTAEDITESKRIRDELAESEAKFRKLFEDNPSPSSIHSYPDGAYLDVNAEYESFLGYKPREMLGKTPRELHLWVDLEQLRDLSKRLRANSILRDQTTQLRRKDGRIITVGFSWILTTINDRPCLVTINRNITERHAAQESRTLLASVVESASEAITSSDLTGNITSCNPAAERLYGYSAGELVGRPYTILLPPERHVFIAEVRRRLIDGAAAQHFETEALRKDGQRLMLSMTASAIRNADGQPIGITGIARDLAEHQLAEQARALAHTNQELARLAYAASHDLKEPLRMISVYTQLTQRRLDQQLDSEEREFTAQMLAGARRMIVLVDGLLEYTRTSSEAAEPEAVDCRAAVQEAIGNLRPAIAEARASVTVQGALPVVQGSPQMLTRLFQNLIGNALKFHAADPPVVVIQARRADNLARFVVQDNGIGIEPAHWGKIFNMFERLHGQEEYPGTGMGLAICRKIVERHNGRIWVESSPSQGSRFYFTLPLAPDTAGASER